MSAVEIKFAVSSKQPFGLGDMMSGFGPKRTRVHSASRHARDDLPVEEQVDDQRRDGDQKDVHETSARLFRQTTHPEAVFFWTDFVAFEVLSVARELGLHVPGDVAIMGHPFAI